MPNFGKETLGTVNHSIQNSIKGTFFVCPEDSYAQSITAFISNAYGKLKYGLHRRSDNALIAVSDEIDIPLNTSAGLITLNLPSKPQLFGGTQYALEAISEGQCLISAAVNYAGNGIELNISYASAFPSTLMGYSSTVFDYTIFLTYSTTEPLPSHFLTISPSINGQTNPLSGTYSLEEGIIQTIIAAPDVEYEIDFWTKDGAILGADTQIEVIMDMDHTISVTFKLIYVPPVIQKHRLTINSNPIQSISPLIEAI